MQQTWDLYFLRLAKEVASNSKCLSRKIGAVLVKNKAVVSTGYNGPARGMKHCDERDLKFYLALEGNEPDELLGNASKCPRRELGYKSGEGFHSLPLVSMHFSPHDLLGKDVILPLICNLILFLDI